MVTPKILFTNPELKEIVFEGSKRRCFESIAMVDGVEIYRIHGLNRLQIARAIEVNTERFLKGGYANH